MNSKTTSIRIPQLQSMHPARRIARVARLLGAGLIDNDTAEMRVVELAAEARKATKARLLNNASVLSRVQPKT